VVKYLKKFILSGKSDVFTALCDAYKPSLLIDVSYNDVSLILS
jgi:hypothetical protein